MKCFHCNKKIKDNNYVVTPPDGDFFHTECLPKHKKERDHFFNETIHDDKKFANWLGVPEKMIKKR